MSNLLASKHGTGQWEPYEVQYAKCKHAKRILHLFFWTQHRFTEVINFYQQYLLRIWNMKSRKFKIVRDSI